MPSRSPLRAIRQNCLDCMGGKENRGYTKLVEECTTRECPLWSYRFGESIKLAKSKGRDVVP